MEHVQQPSEKVPSRNGGVKRVVCSCGWKSQPSKAEFREAEFVNHLTDEGAL